MRFHVKVYRLSELSSNESSSRLRRYRLQFGRPCEPFPRIRNPGNRPKTSSLASSRLSKTYPSSEYSFGRRGTKAILIKDRELLGRSKCSLLHLRAATDLPRPICLILCDEGVICRWKLALDHSGGICDPAPWAWNPMGSTLLSRSAFSS